MFHVSPPFFPSHLKAEESLFFKVCASSSIVSYETIKSPQNRRYILTDVFFLIVAIYFNFNVMCCCFFITLIKKDEKQKKKRSRERRGILVRYYQTISSVDAAVLQTVLLFLWTITWLEPAANFLLSVHFSLLSTHPFPPLPPLSPLNYTLLNWLLSKIVQTVLSFVVSVFTLC